jgi:hypothetical protein
MDINIITFPKDKMLLGITVEFGELNGFDGGVIEIIQLSIGFLFVTFELNIYKKN